MDFGDALHLALSAGDEVFATFDKALGKVATLERHCTSGAGVATLNIFIMGHAA